MKVAVGGLLASSLLITASSAVEQSAWGALHPRLHVTPPANWT